MRNSREVVKCYAQVTQRKEKNGKPSGHQMNEGLSSNRGPGPHASWWGENSDWCLSFSFHCPPIVLILLSNCSHFEKKIWTKAVQKWEQSQMRSVQNRELQPLASRSTEWASGASEGVYEVHTMEWIGEDQGCTNQPTRQHYCCRLPMFYTSIGLCGCIRVAWFYGILIYDIIMRKERKDSLMIYVGYEWPYYYIFHIWTLLWVSLTHQKPVLLNMVATPEGLLTSAALFICHFPTQRDIGCLHSRVPDINKLIYLWSMWKSNMSYIHK